MKTLRFLCLTLLLLSFSYNQAQACCSIGVSVTGPATACPNSTSTYTVNPDNAAIVEVALTNGTFVSVAGNPAPPGANFVVVPSPVQGANFSVPFTVVVNWGTGARAIDVLASNSANCNAADQITVNNPGTASISSGPSGPVCRTTTSASFGTSGSGGSGVTRLWTSSSSGAPLSFSSTTGTFTTVSGFTPDNLYSINFQNLCNGTVISTSSRTIITVIPTPCTPPAPPTEEEINNFQQADFQEEELNTVHYLENDNGVLKVDSPDDIIWGEQALSEVKVFPNPVAQNATLTINLPNLKENYQIELMDMQGRILNTFTTTDYRFEMSTAGYPAGIYNIRITADGFNTSKRIIIN